MLFPEEKVGRQTGFEPATPGTTNQCSNQLSYYRHKELRNLIPCEIQSMRKHSGIFGCALDSKTQSRT